MDVVVSLPEDSSPKSSRSEDKEPLVSVSDGNGSWWYPYFQQGLGLECVGLISFMSLKVDTFIGFIPVQGLVATIVKMVVDVPAVGHDALAALRSELTKSVTGFTLALNVEYPSEALANIVKTTLGVDPELQPDKVQREMSVQGARLSVTFTALEARFLRASFSAFMDLLVLATRTVEQFGPASTYGQYCHLD